MSSPGAGLQAPRTARHSQANAIFLQCQRDLEILSSIISSLIFIHVPRRSMEPFFFLFFVIFSSSVWEKSSRISAQPKRLETSQLQNHRTVWKFGQKYVDTYADVVDVDSQSVFQAESLHGDIWMFFGETFWITVLITRTTRPRHTRTLLFLFAMFEMHLLPPNSQRFVCLCGCGLFFYIGIQGCIMMRWSRGHFQPHPLGLHLTAAATTVFLFEECDQNEVWVNN